MFFLFWVGGVWNLILSLVKEESNYILDQTRPFTLRFNLCMFLFKENSNESFWLRLNFSAKFWTRSNTGQILYPGKPTSKFYWTTLKSYKLTLPLQLFDQRHLQTHATTKILVVLTKSIFITIFRKSSLDWFNTGSPEKTTNLQDNFKITKMQVLWSLTIPCTITDAFIFLLFLLFYFFY